MPGVEFALHEMEVEGKKVNFLASNDLSHENPVKSSLRSIEKTQWRKANGLSHEKAPQIKLLPFLTNFLTV